MEVTYAQNDSDCIARTSESIQMLHECFEGKMIFGAGTVLNREQIEATFSAGGKFCISPNVNKEVIMYTKELGMISIPGALTSTEILDAHNIS